MRTIPKCLEIDVREINIGIRRDLEDKMRALLHFYILSSVDGQHGRLIP